jgi:hypothetical protein
VGSQKGSSISPDEYLELFKGAMKKLAMAVDKEMGEARYLIYFEQLHTYGIEEIQAAVDQAIHNEEYNVIPTVGKLIRYIEDAREEQGERWPKLEFKEEWPTMTSERLKELIQPFYDRLAKQEKELKERRETSWKKNKKILEGQINLVKLNADPAEQK